MTVAIITALLFVMALAAVVTDSIRYIIPNRLVLLIALLYAVAALLIPSMHTVQGLIAAAVVFAGGFIMFSLKVMGGGDVKLITAFSLWTGTERLGDFIIITAIYGGVLSVFLLLARSIISGYAGVKNGATTLPRILSKGQPVPYGIAISCAFITLLFFKRIHGLQ